MLVLDHSISSLMAGARSGLGVRLAVSLQRAVVHLVRTSIFQWSQA